jgi:hypothetical protein
VDNSRGVVGVSTQATLHPVKVLTALGAGSTSDIAAGIEYTAKQGWDVASLSLGGSSSNLMRDACEYAHNQGVLLIAAGNSGPCTNSEMGTIGGAWAGYVKDNPNAPDELIVYVVPEGSNTAIGHYIVNTDDARAFANDEMSADTWAQRIMSTVVNYE